MARDSYVWLIDLQLSAVRRHSTTKAYRLDCDQHAAECRFIIQSENETEALDLAKRHMSEAHGQDYSADELREVHLR